VANIITVEYGLGQNPQLMTEVSLARVEGLRENFNRPVELDRKRKPKRYHAAKGVNSATTLLSLPANAIVDEYWVTLTAARSDYAVATAICEVRESKQKPLEVILDFGKMLTINALRFSKVLTKVAAYSWLGTKFDLDNPVSVDYSAEKSDGSGKPVHTFSAELRTERLLLKLSNEIDFDELKKSLDLSLPDLPSNLSLHINGGPAVWEYPGLVQANQKKDKLDDVQWNKDGELLVSLAEPLQTLLGDASRNELVSVNLELKSQTPGEIKVIYASDSLRLLHRQSFKNDSDLRVNFNAEGQMPVSFSAPENSASRISGVQLKLAADFTEERATPALEATANGICSVVLGNGKAACVRLDAIKNLNTISAIRLPLVTTSSRIEARVMVWQGSAEGPVALIEKAESEVLSWSGGSHNREAQEHWQLFTLAKPLEIQVNEVYWMALIVERGEVSWPLASADGDVYPLRVGTPAGPWRSLPSVFAAGTSLGAVAGRLHVIGLSEQTTPLAPLQLSFAGSHHTRALNPTADGQLVFLPIEENAEVDKLKVELLIVSRAIGTLTLSEVDVITEEITA